ncbi:hypothetical protein [Luteibacter yeojuensis]
MTGVRKGYEEYLAGRECEPFKLTSAKSLGLQESSDIVELELSFSGNPRFPLRVITYHDKNISGSDKCHKYPHSRTFLSAPDNGVFNAVALCPPGVTQSRLEIKATDADGLLAVGEIDLACPGRDWDQSDDCNFEPRKCDCSERFYDYSEPDKMDYLDEDQDAANQTLDGS